MGIAEKMQQLETYGDLSKGNLQGRVNGECSTIPVVMPRYKRRKVSAVRDFPPGCGPNASVINVRTDVAPSTVSNGEKPVNEVESGAVLETDSVKAPELTARSSLTEVSNTSDYVQVFKPSSDLEINERTNIASSTDCNSNGMKPVDEVKTGAVPETDSVKTPEIAGKLSHPAVVNDPDNVEVLKPSRDLEVNAKPVTSVDMMEEIEKMNLKPEGNELLNIDNAGPIVQSKVSEPGDPGLEMESNKVDNVSLFGEIVPNSGSESPPSPTITVSNAIFLERTVTRKYPPRRSISAIRDFPPLCGRNAPLLSKEERKKAVASAKSRTSGEDDARNKIQAEVEGGGTGEAAHYVLPGNTSEVGTGQEDAIQKCIRAPHAGNLNKPSKKFQTECTETDVELGGRKGETEKKIMVSNVEVTDAERELGKEIVPCYGEVGGLEGKAGKEIVVYDVEREWLEEEMGKDILSDTAERVIVHALMAEPNCPWRQGKGVKRSPGSDTQRIKEKKRDFSRKRKSKSAFMKKKNVGGSSLKKKSSPTENAVLYGMGELGFKDEDSEQDEDPEDYHVSYRPRGFQMTLIPVAPTRLKGDGDSNDASVTRNKVRETMRLFQAVCRKLLQEEEAKSKHGGSTFRRIDLEAAKILKGKYVNTGKQILGPVPGVEVGDEFHYRMELNIVGLHRQVMAGIDFLRQGTKVLATSIVASGGYDDDMDESDVLVYSGSGGNASGSKEPEDQKLERGNLALKNSIDEKTPVRVIRGIKETKASENSDSRAKLVTTYVYDGLYLVKKYWQEVGSHGKMVFKFSLERIPGQPELAWNVAKKSKKIKEREGLCDKDISQGKELIPICAVNTIDDEKPPPFKYITRMMYPDWCRPLPLKGCDCIGGCHSESQSCHCAVRNGGEIPYNFNGAIVEAKSLVYECGPSCKCPSSCPNRVSQHGVRLKLEIFKTESRGWGVRSLSSIPSGSFICEYIGELLEDKVAEKKIGNDEYLFDIGQNYNDQNPWEGLSSLMPDLVAGSCEVVEGDGFTIDAEKYGNIGRFINHSCSPNLYAQNVLYDHEDKRIPHIMFFAVENIPPLQELSYHYNYAIGEVRDTHGNIKIKNCYCGSSECIGRMY